MSDMPDDVSLRAWIGARDVAEDILTQTLIDRFYATLMLPSHRPDVGAPAPRLIHFCLCQPAVAMDGLSEDGHPETGGFLPPVPLPRRMWAASDLHFGADIRVGDHIRRESTVSDVQVKKGRSGTLCFVTVDHRVESNGELAVTERQSIVYREAAPPGGLPSTYSGEPVREGAIRHEVEVSNPILFRYSALTFNSHRIHYDMPYTRDVENYPGLIVHGPLQATLLLHLAQAAHGGLPPSTFSFRAVSPVFAGQRLLLHADMASGGEMALWSAAAGGAVAMTAKAGWAA